MIGSTLATGGTQQACLTARRGPVLAAGGGDHAYHRNWMTDQPATSPPPRPASAARRVAEIVAAAERAAEELRAAAERRGAERIAEAERAARLRVQAADDEAQLVHSEAEQVLEQASDEAAALRDEAARQAQEALDKAADAARQVIAEARAAAREVLRDGEEISANLRELGDALRANADRLLRDIRLAHAELTSRLDRAEPAARSTGPAAGRAPRAAAATATDRPPELDVPEFIPRARTRR